MAAPEGLAVLFAPPPAAAAPRHEVLDPGWMVSALEYAMTPAESVNLRETEVPEAMSTVQL